MFLNNYCLFRFSFTLLLHRIYPVLFGVSLAASAPFLMYVQITTLLSKSTCSLYLHIKQSSPARFGLFPVNVVNPFGHGVTLMPCLFLLNFTCLILPPYANNSGICILLSFLLHHNTPAFYFCTSCISRAKMPILQVPEQLHLPPQSVEKMPIPTHSNSYDNHL